MEKFCFCRLFDGIQPFLSEQFSFEAIIFVLLFLLSLLVIIAIYQCVYDFFDVFLNHPQYRKYEFDYTATNGKI